MLQDEINRQGVEERAALEGRLKELQGQEARLQQAHEEEKKRLQQAHEEEKKRLVEESAIREAAGIAKLEAQFRWELEQQQLAAAEQERILLEEAQALRNQINSGIQPEVWPTEEERARAEEVLLKPRENYVHCAIAGLAGSGKSSLINALRGLKTNQCDDPRLAKTGATETTMEIGRYPDPSTTAPRKHIVWYDIPGAGTLSIKGWQYFNAQGLFIFDLIIVLIDNRFTEPDIAILKHCERFKIPSLIVRSKANQHIGNLMQYDFHYDSDDDDRENFSRTYQAARTKFIEETRRNVASNLKMAEMNPEKNVHIVSCDALAYRVCGEFGKLKKKNQLIDEDELLMHCLEAIRAKIFLNKVEQKQISLSINVNPHTIQTG